MPVASTEDLGDLKSDLNGPSYSKVNFHSSAAANHAQDDTGGLKSHLSSNLDGPNDLKASASCQETSTPPRTMPWP